MCWFLPYGSNTFCCGVTQGQGSCSCCLWVCSPIWPCQFPKYVISWGSFLFRAGWICCLHLFKKQIFKNSIFDFNCDLNYFDFYKSLIFIHPGLLFRPFFVGQDSVHNDGQILWSTTVFQNFSFAANLEISSCIIIL